jgi:(p)ppGpp synthase/HD superfamily hydrolase
MTTIASQYGNSNAKTTSTQLRNNTNIAKLNKLQLAIYDLKNKIKSTNKRTKVVDENLITKAIKYTIKWHGDQKRQTGEPYCCHPIEVASIVLDYYADTDTIIIALLHDVIEDTIITPEEITEIFGEQITLGVQSLTRHRNNNNKIGSIELMFLLGVTLKRHLLLIKLIDRIHNLQTINIKSVDKINKIINESEKYFVPLANYLELYYPGVIGVIGVIGECSAGLHI